MTAVAQKMAKNSTAGLIDECTSKQGLCDAISNIIFQAKRFGKGEDMDLTQST